MAAAAEVFPAMNRPSPSSAPFRTAVALDHKALRPVLLGFWCASLMCLCGFVSVNSGVDANWDLQNYHLFLPYQSLNGDYLYHIAPAQLQSYFNPLLDMYFYALIKSFNAHPRLIAFLMGIPQGINLWLISLMTWFVCRTRVAPSITFLLVLATIFLALTGAGTYPLIGTTMGDLVGVTPILAGVTIMVHTTTRLDAGVSTSTDRDLALRLFAATTLAGVGAGLKLVGATYAVGLVIGAIFSLRLPILRTLVISAFGGAIGFLITGGLHAVTMIRWFHNPIFPMMNQLFRSPDALIANYKDTRFTGKTLSDIMFYPWTWSTSITHGMTSELDFRDARIGLAVVALGASALICLMRTQRGAAAISRLSRLMMFLLVFVATTYVLWLYQFGIYRYLVGLEMLSGVLLVAAILEIAGGLVTLGAVGVAAFVSYTTSVPLDWGHLPFGENYISVEGPKLRPSTLVVTVGPDPVSYLAPLLGANARWLGLDNSFLQPENSSRLVALEHQVIEAHKGEILVLEAGADPARLKAVLSRYGLSESGSNCQIVSSNLTSDRHKICSAVRN